MSAFEHPRPPIDLDCVSATVGEVKDFDWRVKGFVVGSEGDRLGSRDRLKLHDRTSG
jgi:hypothetical protein